MATTATRHIPTGATCVRSKQSDSVVYLYALATGKLAAIGYTGRSAKPAFRYSFGDATYRAEFVAKWFREQDATASAKRERKAAPRCLIVGDVLVSSWGYEQTNVDFYEVVRLVGAKSVALRPIKAEKVPDGDMTGYAVPLPGEYIGPEFTKLVDADGGVRLSSYSFARKAERVAGPSGTQLGYRPQRWTAYA